METRFWSKVSKDITGGCWEWQKCKTKRGYGKFSVGRGVWRFAHRIAWELSRGEIPALALVCHSCDNPSCCNPEHLFLGTDADNVRDMLRKGRNGYTGLQGEKNCRAKLKDGDILAIRARRQEGQSIAEIAAGLPVSKTNVGLILQRKIWSHL